MQGRNRKTAHASKPAPQNVRATVTLRAELYKTLEALARQKKVSTAWVLREAAEQYAAEQWPLFQRETA